MRAFSKTTDFDINTAAKDTYINFHTFSKCTNVQPDTDGLHFAGGLDEQGKTG